MSLFHFIASAGKAIAEWHDRRRAYAELMSLDDRSLADIGIRRSQIRGIVEESFATEQGQTLAPQRRHRLNRPKAA